MKTIQLLLSGVFLIWTLLWVRTAAQRCLDSVSVNGNLGSQKKMIDPKQGNCVLDRPWSASESEAMLD